MSTAVIRNSVRASSRFGSERKSQPDSMSNRKSIAISHSIVHQKMLKELEQ